MAFSFAPGQQPLPQNSTDVPALVVPAIPTIATNVAPPEQVSPFAFRNRNKSNFSVYFQFSIFGIFGIMVFSAIGLFVYQGYLSSQIEAKKLELGTKQSSFKKLPLDEMIKFTDRLRIVNQTLKKQASVRTAFLLLESGIENPVTYTKFTISFSEAKKSYLLDLTASAPTYHSMIQQIETLKDPIYKNYFSNIQITNVSLDEKGNGMFKIGMNVSLQGVLPETVTMSLSGASTSASTSTPQPASQSTDQAIVVPASPISNSTPQ